MAQWREFNATNEPDTCLWCGNKLRRRVTHFQPDGSYDANKPIRAEKRGDYSDGHFCGLRCAYSFAVALADHGRRLQPKGT